ncbi:MAG: hypothetical protein CMN05_15665 [Roseibacillus sp.]|jgi:serine/threonine protein kinase|nr:hypothetical protein [Roseibacillus sp.]MBP35494.1 hypothetical protein [Roseibacillus sp.]MCP4729543.1 hypothetical protein [Roseibacillus sp.]MDP7106308.1 hypothetical protein [Roseibacillus sp.]MDP7308752.1 hypothetical protein [Roseibacillus sp.]|tara:strand:- start:11523 stop:13910 length:2388 start_codon:yes stop_codon:yes gene_type:complete
MDSDAQSSDTQPGASVTLAGATSSGPIDHKQAVELIISLCEKTAPAHQRGLAYGGLAPRKVLIDENLNLSITLEPASGPLESIDESNRDYVAPELLSGKDCVAHCDVYSLGRILYRLLTGTTPQGDTPPAPSTIRKTPLVLDTLIKKATSPDPGARISSVENLANDLRQTARLRPTIKRPEAPVTRIPERPRTPLPSANIRPDRSIEIPWGIITKIALALVALSVILKLASNFGQEVEEGISPAPSDPDRDRKVAERRDPIDRDRDRQDAARKPKLKPRTRPPVPRERLRDSLPRLKTALHAGQRNELPPAAIWRNDSTYALWDRSMTWQNARAFAEAHGAHLAILTDRGERQWIRDQFDLRYPVWIGAGKGAHDRWQWLDGTLMPTTKSVGTPEDRYLALNENGIIMPANTKRKCDVLLEWRDDGTNPGTEREQLKRVKTLALSGSRESLLRGEGLPIGTRTFGNSHFYALRGDMVTWDEALDLSAIHGAYLAVPSSAEEHRWICENFWIYLGTGQGLWLGGFRGQAGQPWKWVSREAWHSVGFPENVNTHPLFNRILLQGAGETGTGRWTMVDGSRKKAPGILLEWSSPADVSAGEVARGFAADPWLAAINRKTQQIVGSDLSAFDWDRNKLIEQYVRSLKNLIRTQKSATRNALRQPGQNTAARREKLAIWESLEKDLVEASEKDQLLPALPADGPRAFIAIHERTAGTLTQLENKYDTRIKERQKTYRNQIEVQAQALSEQGHLETANDLRSALRPLKPDLKAFLRLLYPQNPDRGTLPWEPRRDLPGEDK